MIKEAWKLYNEMPEYRGLKKPEPAVERLFKDKYSEHLVYLLQRELSLTKATKMKELLTQLSPEAKKAVIIFATLRRSKLFYTKHKYSCSLYPIVAGILKTERGIDYEHWLGEFDPLQELGGISLLSLFFGPSLLEVYGDRDKLEPNITREMVEQFLSYTGGSTPPTGYSKRNYVRTGGATFSKLSSILLTKTWYAHQDKRQNGMVLNIWDWDKPGTGNCLVAGGTGGTAGLCLSDDELPF